MSYCFGLVTITRLFIALKSSIRKNISSSSSGIALRLRCSGCKTTVDAVRKSGAGRWNRLWAQVRKLLLGGMLLTGFVYGASVQAEELQVYRISLPAQSVAKSLTDLSEQIDVLLLFDFNVASKLTANPVNGDYTLALALEVMLAGTGFSGGLSKKGVLMISLMKSEDANDQKESTGEKIELKTRKSILASVIGLLIGTGGTQGALALEDGNSAKKSQKPIMEEIIVTATKRDTTLQDTPIAISAFTSQDLGRQGIENYEDFSRQVPGVVLSGGKNFAKFTIRGIQTSSTTSSNGEQKPVTVYIDEIPVSTFSVVTPNLRLYDVERVEVLRGPQGTSFGSGSMAGGVRVINKKADLKGFDASVRVEAADIREGGLRQRYSGMVNVPLVEDTLAVRAVGYVRKEPGFIDNLGTFGFGPVDDENKSDEWGLRSSLRWAPSDNLDATFSIMHDDIEANSLGSFQQPGLGRLKRATFLTEGIKVQTDNVNLTIEYELPWASLVSSTSYATADTNWDLDLDAIFGGFMPFGYSEGQKQDAVVQELRLVSNGGGQWDWLAGAFYLNRKTDNSGATFTSRAFLDSQGIDYSSLPHLQSPGVDVDPSIRVVEDNESAIFGELTYHLTDTLSITGGLRYTQFEFQDTTTTQGNTTNVFDLIFGFAGGVATAAPDSYLYLTTGKKNVTTSKLTLNWQPADDRTFYFTAAEGFRRPHPNVTALAPNTVDPLDPTIIPLVANADSLWNYEIGAKSRWLDGRLRANIAVYFIDWSDIQLSATRGSDAAPYTANAGDVESKGIEAEFLLYPSDNLELGLNLTFANSEIVKLTQTDAIESGEVQGSPLASPETQVSGFAQYVWPIANGSSVYARVDYQYVGDYPNAPPNVPGSPTQAANANFAIIDAYTNVNAQLGWENEKLTVVLFGENIFDNDDFTYINPDVFSQNRFGTLRPRTIGLRLDWNI